MIVSIMQPYFFPYIGYFQLMAACDVFVVFDDVQYIRRGWVNRNRILVNGAPHWITMPVESDDHVLPINARRYLLGERLATRMGRRIADAYRMAPQFREVMPLVEEMLATPEDNVAMFNTRSLTRIARHLGIGTPIRIASGLEKDRSLAGQALVIDLCRRLGATRYVNPIGGVELYDAAAFAEHGIALSFLQSQAPAYPQFDHAPQRSLSIIDVLMFNDLPTVRDMLGRYVLLGPEELGDAREPAPPSAA